MLRKAPKVLGRKHFPHTTAFEQWYTTTQSTHARHTHWNDEALAGLSLMRTGDNKAVARARELLNKFTEELPSITQKWTLEVAGGFVNVGAFLAGDPEHMWRQEEDKIDSTPLRVWLGLTSSIGVTPTQIFERGIALAAFALALSERRTVYLTPYVLLGAGNTSSRYRTRETQDDYSQPDGAIISWDLQTSPLILSEISAALTRSEVTRALGLSACYALNSACNGSWIDCYQNEPKMRRLLGCAQDDVWIGSIHLQDPLLTDPIKWVKEQLAFFTHAEAERTY